MLVKELLKFTRYNKLLDKASPPLWSDAVIVTYLDEGQTLFSRKTDYFIEDDIEISLSEGESVYDLDSKVAFVYAVRFDGYDYIRLAPATEGWTPDSTMSTMPTRYTLDRKTNSIRFYPVPDGPYTAILRVARLPAALALDDLEAEPELREEYQIGLMDWAVYRCLTHNDVDGGNDMAAEKALARFNEMVSRAKHDTYRLRMGNQPRVHGDRVK